MTPQRIQLRLRPTRGEAIRECVEMYRLGVMADAEDLYDDQPCHADVLLELANQEAGHA